LTRVFVDTSAWIALANARDQWHTAAEEYYLFLLQRRASLCTSNYVLAEAYTHIRYDAGHASALRFQALIAAAEKQHYLQVLWVDQATAEAAWQIFAQYADQFFSFTDCTSFVLARQARVDEVFAFDEDFRTMGFIVKP